jgi:hypothetical protein
LLLCLALVLGGAARAEGTPTEVSPLRLQRSEEGLLLSTTVEFELPAAIEDALQKGIPMYFVAEAALLRDRWYWYDKQISTAARHMRLSYQPLTRRWRLVISPTPIGQTGLALGQTFETRDEALSVIKRISHWKIAEPSELDLEGRYNVDFRFRLDVSQLPRPFQIGAVGQADWNISAARNQRLIFEAPR